MLAPIATHFLTDLGPIARLPDRVLVSLGEEIQWADAATAVPSAPTGVTDGTDLSSIQDGSGFAALTVLMRVEKQAGTGDVTLTGPVKVYGLRGTEWYLVGPGYLNNGNDIVVGDQGFVETMEFVAALDRIEVVPAGLSGSGSPAYDGYLQEVICE